MRKILYIIVLSAALLVPVNKSNVGDLQPMEAVYLGVENGQVVIRTDTEDLGIGKSVSEAIRNMQDTTSGIVYLDTADFLLLNPNAQKVLWEAEQYMKPTVRVCLAKGGIDIVQATAYLSVHKPEVEIQEASYKNIQILAAENGKFRLKAN